MEHEIFTLNNGFRIVRQQANGAAAHCAFFVNCGSRDEKSDEYGLAHFLEHCLFKGTQKRNAREVLSRIDEVGGELNAYTSKEETTVHASFLTKHNERAVELLCDVMFNSTFPERELTKEKLVVIDEIYSYLDSPYERIFDEFEDLLFKGHELGHNILGTPESVRSFRREHLAAFTERRYTPDEMVFAYRGNLTREKLQSLLEKYTPDLPRTNVSPRAAFTENPPRRIVETANTNQAHFITGKPVFGYHDPRYPAAVLLNNILGGPAMNSILNLNISEKYGFAYNIESNYASYENTGVFHIYLGTESNHLERAESLILKELHKLTTAPLSKSRLQKAKQQIIGQITLSGESGLNRMMQLGKSVLNFGSADQYENVFEHIEAVTADELLETAKVMLNPDHFSSITYLPGER